MTKKTKIIVIVSVILIILSLAISIYMPNKEKIEENFEENSTTYCLLKEEDKFGVINQDGEIILHPEYQEIVIPNEHRAVFICLKDNNKKIINEKKQEIFTKYNNVEPIELTDGIKDYKYNQKVMIYEKDGKLGLIGFDEKIVTEAKYEEISSFEYKDDEIYVKEKGKYGIIDSNGKQIIKNIYDSIKSDQYYSDPNGYNKSGYIVCNVTDDGYRYGYYDCDGQKVLDAEYNEIIRITLAENNSDICLIAAKNGQYGVFINGNKIINTQYQSISYDYTMGMFIVERTGQYGAINSKGAEVLKTEYTDIQVKGIYLYTKKGEEQKVIDKTGKAIEIPFTTIISATSNPDYYIKIDESNESYSILNSNFEEISKQKYKYLEYVNNNYFIATDFNNKNGIIDLQENKVIDFVYDTIQVIKDKKIIQALNFENNLSVFYNSKLEKILEISNVIIDSNSDYVKMFNDEEKYYFDENGNELKNGEELEKKQNSKSMLDIDGFEFVVKDEINYYIKKK